MDAWISESIGFWNEVHDGARDYDKDTADSLINRFMEILETGRKEYEYEPASKYYTEGYSTYKRMAESPEEYILFLRDPVVPPQNNLVERLARKYKRKAHQVMSFRSQNGSDWFCDGLSVTESIKNRGENVYEEVTARFNRHC